MFLLGVEMYTDVRRPLLVLLRIYHRYFTPPSDYWTPIKSLHTKSVPDSKSLLSHNHIPQTSPQISAAETNISRPYRSTLSQLRSSFCRYLHSYRERIGLFHSPSVLPVSGTPHHRPWFLLFIASNTLDREEPAGASAPVVGVHVWPPFLRSPTSSFSSLWASSIWRARKQS